MTVEEIAARYWPYVTTCALALWSVYQHFSNRGQRIAATSKTKEEISDAIIDRLREEVKDLRENKGEILRANVELITMNKELIKSNESFSNRIHELEIEVKNLKNELIQKNLLQ